MASLVHVFHIGHKRPESTCFCGMKTWAMDQEEWKAAGSPEVDGQAPRCGRAVLTKGGRIEVVSNTQATLG